MILYTCNCCGAKSTDLGTDGKPKQIRSSPATSGWDMPAFPGTPVLLREWCRECWEKASPGAKSAHDQAVAARDAAIADVVAQVAAGKIVESVVLTVSHSVRIKAVEGPLP